MSMTYKWGADRSGCQKNYKQNFENERSGNTHTRIFITSLVPLLLVVNMQSMRTGSLRFCVM